jgi:hypothetical protein
MVDVHDEDDGEDIVRSAQEVARCRLPISSATRVFFRITFRCMSLLMASRNKLGHWI